jgi:DNA-directed RNA polymerase
MQVNSDAKAQSSLTNVNVNNSSPLINLPIIPINSNTNGVRPLFSALQGPTPEEFLSLLDDCDLSLSSFHSNVPQNLAESFSSIPD